MAKGHLDELQKAEKYPIKYPIKGAMRFGTFKSIDFKKNWYVKIPVIPRSLIL